MNVGVTHDGLHDVERHPERQEQRHATTSKGMQAHLPQAGLGGRRLILARHRLVGSTQAGRNADPALDTAQPRRMIVRRGFTVVPGPGYLRTIGLVDPHIVETSPNTTR